MSKEAVTAFKAKVDSSDDLKKIADTLFDEFSKELTQREMCPFFDRIAELGKKHGFEFTADEAFQNFKEELSDEQLDNVAGGALRMQPIPPQPIATAPAGVARTPSPRLPGSGFGDTC